MERKKRIPIGIEFYKELVDKDYYYVDKTVVSCERTEKTVKSPRLYDLTSLQREANRIYGLTAHQTLTAAQNLYEAKLITYPRTNCIHIH